MAFRLHLRSQPAARSAAEGMAEGPCRETWKWIGNQVYGGGVLVVRPAVTLYWCWAGGTPRY